MAKRVLVFLVMVILTLTACGKDSPVNADKGLMEAREKVEAMKEEVKKVAEEIVEEEPDPLDFYLVMGDPKYNFSGGFLLKRHGRLYSLEMRDTAKAEREDEDFTLPVYYPVEDNEHGGNVICSSGTPMIVIEPNKGDELVCFSSDNIPDLKLDLVEQTGWTIGYGEVYDERFIYNYKMGIREPIGRADNVTVTKHGGEVVYDEKNKTPEGVLANLEKGEEYKVDIVEGTTLRSFNLIADLPTYSFVTGAKRFGDFRYIGDKEEPDYTINGTPTTDEYAIYDISDIPPGLYLVRWTVIEIR